MHYSTGYYARLSVPACKCLTNWLLIFLLITARLLAQAEGPLITSVVVEGNRVTREYIITRELSHPLDQPFDSSLALDDRNRLYNLGIFEWVDVYPRPTTSGEAALIVAVVETFRKIPYPTYYHLKDLGWAYGGGLMVTNFRGLNQSLDVGGTIGAELSYYLLFTDPWFMGNRVSLSSQVMQISRNHPEYSFRYRKRNFKVGIGKYFLDKTVYIAGATTFEDRRVMWPPDDPLKLVWGDLRHRIFTARGMLLWRTTDIWRDPTTGFQLQLDLAPVWGLDSDSPTYGLVKSQGAVFVPLWKGYRPLVWGAVLAVSHATQPTPIYLTQYVGGQWVRGYNVAPERNPLEIQDRLKGSSIVFTSMELRQTLFPRRLWQQTEVGLSGVLFVDAGWGYGPGIPLRQALPLVGYGVGLRFFFPNIDALALDVGTNPYDHILRYHLNLTHKF
ncbi:MAG: BamA/TamA family outer membrane protein [Fidelibacterota bacterium]|nr:MAG: BamA/TamA family outer membrane protein [Candidatus Neomarinimicrobiota bacterium]